MRHDGIVACKGSAASGWRLTWASRSQRSLRGGLPLFDLKGLAFGIAGHEFLGCAVDEQIEIFEYDRADERGCSFGFDDGGEGAMAAEELKVDTLRGSRASPGGRPYSGP